MAQRQGPARVRSSSKDFIIDFRLVLVGKTGSGKSSSGNTILGEDVFSAAVRQSSVTRECVKRTGQVFGRQLTVVDTPGFFDTSLPQSHVNREISKCVNMSAPGPHAILLVIKMGPFTDEEQSAARQVEEVFGEAAWQYTMVLFTQDSMDQADVPARLQEAGPELRGLLSRVQNRYHVLNNHRADMREQVLGLLEKVEQMVTNNGDRFYSNPTYVQVVEMLQQREKELREFYGKKLEEKIKAIEEKYKREEQVGAIKKRKKSEIQEVERYYQKLKQNARQVVEQSAPKDTMEEIQKFHMTLKVSWT